MEKDNRKEFYRLWWEFTKRSKVFPVLREVMKKNIPPWKIITSITEDQLPSEITEKVLDSYIFIFSYDLVNNKISFEQFWERYTKKEPLVLDGYEYLKTRHQGMNFSVPGIKVNSEFFVSIEDVISIIAKIDRGERLLIAIDLDCDSTVDAILKNIRIKIKEAKKLIKKEPCFLKIHSQFPSGTTAEIVQRYLDVYDCYKEYNKGQKHSDKADHGTWGHIIRKIPSYQAKKENINEALKLEVRRDFKKALKIVSNVEKGVFPGKI